MSDPDISHESDDLAAARGFLNGTWISLVLWGAILCLLPWALS